MKPASIILFLFSFCLMSAQDEEPVINYNYQFNIVYPESIPPFMEGSYLFKTDVEYFTYQSTGIFNPILIPSFFENNEMGLVILRNCSDNAFYKIGSVIETHSRIIVNLIVITGRYWKPGMLGNLMFLKLQRSNKEVYISETYDEGDEIPENYGARYVPY